MWTTVACACFSPLFPYHRVPLKKHFFTSTHYTGSARTRNHLSFSLIYAPETQEDIIKVIEYLLLWETLCVFVKSSHLQYGLMLDWDRLESWNTSRPRSIPPCSHACCSCYSGWLVGRPRLKPDHQDCILRKCPEMELVSLSAAGSLPSRYGHRFNNFYLFSFFK